MNSIKRVLKLSGTGFTNGQYYESMNLALKRLNDEHTMLHYPLFINESDSFIQSQKNLTDYCISLLDPLKDKEVLEIGCGNGVQALYINSLHSPAKMIGIDLNEANIRIAKEEKELAKAGNVDFLVDNAQNLVNIPSDSVDVLLNIESAFHYPDKIAFINEVHRVLKPGGQFLIADLLTTRVKYEGFMKIWGVKMNHHFWNRKKYDDEFEKSDLVVNNHVDISQQVIKGWSMYRNWLPEIKRKHFFQNVAFRIFYVINSKLNMHFLRSRQQYFIFVGHKPTL
jgi:ubiquinone/menaquinone biosynthesis C-methylase UbiE